MGQHFVVDEFVPLGCLHDAVERQDTAEFRVHEDDQMLVIGLGLVQDFRDRELVPETGMKRFLEPTRQVTLPRRWSAISWRFGLKARRMASAAFPGSVLPHMKISIAA